METILLKNGLVVTPQKVQRRDIVLHDGSVSFDVDKYSCDKTLDLNDKYILPGFVDIHFHGRNLFDFTSGQYDPDSESYDSSQSAYEGGFAMLAKQLASNGVTGFYIASIAASIPTLRRCYGYLREYMSKSNPAMGARILGGLLEGTFCNPKMAGAQNPDRLIEPSCEAFDSIEDGGTIKLANIVPELGQKSYDLTEYLTAKGVIVGAGHTAATCEQVARAIEAGLKYCIHFTNGPTGSSYKPFNGGGATEGVLKFESLYAEQICDGYHVNPSYVLDIIRRKGVGRIIGVTDCMFVAGSSVKEFTIGGVAGRVSDNGKYLRVVGKANTLFGSNLTTDVGVENVLNWLTVDMEGIWNKVHPALEFEQAMVACAKMFSENPCALTGRDSDGFGKIFDGAKADLCVLDINGTAGNYKLTVESTIVNGAIVYSAGHNDE